MGGHSQREQQAEQRRAAAAEKAKAEPKQPSAAAKPLPDGLNEDEKTIVMLVRDGVSTPEELIDRCGLAAPRVMSLVTMLEMDGILRRERQTHPRHMVKVREKRKHAAITP